jgi:hypothetical protein
VIRGRIDARTTKKGAIRIVPDRALVVRRTARAA